MPNVKQDRFLRSIALPELMERIDWPRPRVEAHRKEALRQLLEYAKSKSVWYSRTLAKIDPSHFSEADLPAIPIITKGELTESFDQIVTDRKLTRNRCEDFLAKEESEEDDIYLDDAYKVTSSGGSTGVPTLVVHSRPEILLNALTGVRFITRWARRTSAWSEPVVVAVTAIAPRFRSMQVYRFIPSSRTHLISVSTPIEYLVKELNRMHPTLLVTYPSLLPRLAHENRTKRLNIQPKLILAGAEPLLPEHEAAAQTTWGCPVIDGWGSSEAGYLAAGSGFEAGMLVMDDHAIVEPVDRDGKPVPYGETADKVFVTALCRNTLPVIRYEVSDQVTFIGHPAKCGSSFRLMNSVKARREDNFTYPSGTEIRSLLFQEILGHESSVLEYQVQQTRCGVSIIVATIGTGDLQPLAAVVTEQLRSAGLRNPEVLITRVSAIQRTGMAQKLTRFVPLRDMTSP